jgi:D-alanyl-D-alanine carboxypeptidase-like protein
MSVMIPSFLEKEFVINDNMTLLRNGKNLKQFLKYKSGDNIPPNAEIGDLMLIPLHTKVKVTEAKMDDFRNIYVHVVPVNDNDFIPSGWTRATNLLGNFMNEIICYMPDEWDLAPTGDNCTVIDGKALIRTASPDYSSMREIIPVGTYVEITARSGDTDPAGKYVRVRHMSIEEGKLVAGEPIGWTAASNLIAGNSKVFQSEEWQHIEGNNAAWKGGRFIGAKLLVGIGGTGGQLQKIAIETLEPYINLMEAARKDNIELSITSGFRTYAKQKKLRDGYERGQPGFNLAAKPGRSNHQNGIAFDLNTGGFDGAPVYDWMKKNATAHGFIRTVNREHWHWEYHPDLAAEYRKEGKFKLSRVRI